MNFWTLYKRELQGFFISPVAYVVLLGCSLINGVSFAFWLNYLIYNNIKEYTILQACVNSFFFWFLLLVQTPLITMRSFAEEYKSGTIEMLMTAPVQEWEVVLAKFSSAWTFYIVLWSGIPLNLLFVQLFSNQPNIMSWGMWVLPLLIILLLGGLFISIGIYASSLTKNQIIAAILSFALIFLFFTMNFLMFLGGNESLRDFVSYFSALQHMDTYSRGIFDTRPVIFYLSFTLFFLFLTQRNLEGRRLKS